MKAKKDNLMRTRLDGKTVMIIRGPYRYRIGRVLTGQAFMCRGRLTLMIRDGRRWADQRFLFATMKQVEVLK
jgi:hypothetical protein